MLKRFVLLVVGRSPGELGRAASVVLAIGFCLAVGAAEAASLDLEARLDRVLSRAPLARASVGIYVERYSDGQAVYARGADRLLIPASNQKILTALAILQRRLQMPSQWRLRRVT